jgi:hypothetical protein
LNHIDRENTEIHKEPYCFLPCCLLAFVLPYAFMPSWFKNTSNQVMKENAVRLPNLALCVG